MKDKKFRKGHTELSPKLLEGNQPPPPWKKYGGGGGCLIMTLLETKSLSIKFSFIHKPTVYIYAQ